MKAKPPGIPNEHLRHARERLGWSQSHLATLIEANSFTISRWERGRAFPSPFYVQKLVAVFGQSAQALGLLPSEARRSAEGQSPAEDAFRADASGSSLRVNDPLLPPPPAQASRLIGRETLLAQLKARLLTGQTVVLTALHGLPGVGKTALALALAHDAEVRSYFADGILWAGLGQAPQVQEILARWGALLGLPPSQAARLSTSQEWAQALCAAIGERRLLIVLDDVWRLEDALACQVGGATCAYLMTTRRPDLALQVAGEGLAAVPELSEAEGLALLAALAPQVVEAEPDAAREVVQAVGGLPLGLLLLGKYLLLQAFGGQPRRLRSALERLHQRAERLRLAHLQAPLSAHPSLPAGVPLSLQASIGLSVTALSESAQAMLAALALFPPKPNSFSEEAALAVAGEGAETLDRLVDAGLVESRGAERYTLHQTIADYAWVQGRREGAEERLVAYYVAWVEQHQRDYDSFDLELLNIQMAFEAAYTQQRADLLIRGITNWWPYLHVRGLFDLAEQQVLRALEAARTIVDGPGVVLALLQLGQTVEKRGDYPRAVACFEEALEVARQQNVPEHLGALLHALGWIAEKRGAYHEAAAYLEEGLAIARQRGDQEQLVPLFSTLGVVEYKRGNQDSAEQYYQESLRLARQFNLQERIASLLDSLGSLYYIRGESERAESYYREALALARQLGYRDRIASLLNNLGGLATIRGAFTEADAYLQEGLALAERLGHRERMAFLLNSLGESASEQGDAARAASYFREGLEVARQIGYREILGALLTNLGAVLWKIGEEEEAVTCLQEGQAIAEELAYPALRALNLHAWGEWYLEQARLDLAAAAFHTAQQLAEEGQMTLELAIARYGLARAAAAQGDVASARQQGQESLRLFERLGDYRAGVVQRWLEQFAERRDAPGDGWLVQERARRNGLPRQRQGPREAPQ